MDFPEVNCHALALSLIDMTDVFNPAFQEALLKEIDTCMALAKDMQARLDEPGFTQRKADNSPVTLGDLAVQARLEAFIGNATPDWPFIGEENAHIWIESGAELPSIFWLCDPIDGTQDYVSGGSEYAINLALIKDGKAVFGLIASPGRGDVAYTSAADEVSFKNGNDICVLSAPVSRGFKDSMLVAGHGRRKDVERFEQMGGNPAHVLYCASAVKFHALLKGEAQVYLRVRETSEWDIAAGDALVRALGGDATDLENRQPFQYGQPQKQFKLDTVYVSFACEDRP